MKRYVLGLIISEYRSFVVLQEKTHPEWQRGCMNGIGGHVDDGESYDAAMIREAREETTIYDEYPDNVWEHFATIADPGVFEMYCFRTFVADVRLIDAHDGEERLTFVSVRELPYQPVIGNLHWLIPFALDKHVRIPQLFNEQTRAPNVRVASQHPASAAEGRSGV